MLLSNLICHKSNQFITINQLPNLTKEKNLKYNNKIDLLSLCNDSSHQLSDLEKQ